MEYKKIDLGSYKLHLVKTNKFKSILFKIIFRDEIKKDEITIRNMLIDNLVSSCYSYPSKKEVSIKKQDLYGASVYGENKRVGNHILTELSMSILNPKYTEDGMLEESISFFKDIILNPNVKDGVFDIKNFNIIKENNINDIKSLFENSNRYALTKLKESMSLDYAFSFRSCGYLSDIDKITPKSLYDYYLKVLKTNYIDFYIVGDIDFKQIENLIKNNFVFPTFKKKKEDILIKYEGRKKEQVIIEDSSFNQSVLAIGCYFNNLTDKERNYALILYNIIFGNSPDSKLFKVVREENSLAYSISSIFKRTDDLLIINAGLSYSNYDKAISLIKQEIKAMNKGDFALEDLDKAKELVLSVLKDIFDYQDSIVDYYFTLEYVDSDDISKKEEEFKSITKKDIIDVSKKLKIDTIYLLKEKVDEK